MTYANVVSTLAPALAVGGGTASAATKIGTHDGDLSTSSFGVVTAAGTLASGKNVTSLSSTDALDERRAFRFAVYC